MDSLLHDTHFGDHGNRNKRSGSFTSSINDEQDARKLGFLRIFNLVMQGFFGVVWILNFIWVGWFEIYALIMAYAWAIWLLNGLFIIASHRQRLVPFKWSKVITLVYVVQGLSLALALGFFVYGIVLLE